MTIRIIKHEPVPQTGSFEIRFPDGRPSIYFYWDDNPGRRSITRSMSQEEAERAAKESPIAVDGRNSRPFRPIIA